MPGERSLSCHDVVFLSVNKNKHAPLTVHNEKSQKNLKRTSKENMPPLSSAPNGNAVASVTSTALRLAALVLQARP